MHLKTNNIVKKIVDKYKSLPLALKASFWFTVVNFLQRGISMITTPAFTRLLSKYEYGMSNTFVAWQNVLFLVASLSLHKAMMNIFKDTEDFDSVASVVSSLSIIVSFVWVVFGVLFSGQLSVILGISQVLTVCLFLSFIPNAVINCWTVLKRYSFDYKPCVVQSLLTTIGSAVLGILCVVFISPSAEAKTVPLVLVNLVSGIVLYVLMMRRKPVVYNRHIWGFSLKFCLALLPHYLSEFVLQSSDKLMINVMCGNEDVAIYSIAYSVGSLITLVTSAINSTLIPYRYQRLKDQNYKQLAKISNQALGLVAICLVAIMFFAPEIIFIFGGNQYATAKSLVIPICLGVFFNFVFQAFSTVQEYYEKKSTVAIASILCAVTNIILNYIFIKKYGYQAAAYTTFVCYMLFSYLHYLFYRKVCRDVLENVDVYDIKGILLISAFMILSGVIISQIEQIIWVKYVFLMVMLALTMVCFKKFKEGKKK